MWHLEISRQNSELARLNASYDTSWSMILLWPKSAPILFIAEPDQGRKEKHHIPALIHDWRAAVFAANLARQIVP